MLTYRKSTMRVRRAAYANAFEFGPRDFDAGEILPPLYPPPNFP